MNLADAQTVLAQPPAAFEHFNAVHPHSSLKMRTPREFRRHQHRIAQAGQSSTSAQTVSGYAGARSDTHEQLPADDPPQLRRMGERKGIDLNYIEPEVPNQNAYIERFNRACRTEVLDAYLFNYIERVQAIAGDWLTWSNEYRPHDSLGGVPPKLLVPRLINTTAADPRNQLAA